MKVKLDKKTVQAMVYIMNDGRPLEQQVVTTTQPFLKGIRALILMLGIYEKQLGTLMR